MFTFTNFILVGISAAIGAWLRWIITYSLAIISPSIPIGTLTVNLLGGLLIGMSFAALQSPTVNISEETRLIINIGFLGSLTTFSAYSVDILNLMQKGEVGMSIIFIISNALGVLLFSCIGCFIFKLLVD
jgi:CrcB protein